MECIFVDDHVTYFNFPEIDSFSNSLSQFAGLWPPCSDMKFVFCNIGLTLLIQQATQMAQQNHKGS